MTVCRMCTAKAGALTARRRNFGHAQCRRHIRNLVGVTGPVAGDDHGARPLHLPHPGLSIILLKDVMMPVCWRLLVCTDTSAFTVIHGWASVALLRLLRWALKAVAVTVERAAIVDIDPLPQSNRSFLTFQIPEGRPEHPLAPDPRWLRTKRLHRTLSFCGHCIRPGQPYRPRGNGTSP